MMMKNTPSFFIRANIVNSKDLKKVKWHIFPD